MKLSITYKTLGLCVSLLSCLSIAPSAQAGPASLVAWDSQTRNYIKNADVAEGGKIAQTCVSCHGVDGTKKSELLPGFPSLAGQRAEYIFKQLMDYKQGKRIGLGIMPNFATNLDEHSMASVAVWFSKQPLPVKTAKESSKDTLKLVKQGDSARFVPACSACHGLNGEGSIVDVPALAGMSTSYFKTVMASFKSGKRTNDIYKRMRLIVKHLSDEEISDLADYYSSIGE